MAEKPLDEEKAEAFSLVKYNNPILVVKHSEKPTTEKLILPPVEGPSNKSRGGIPDTNKETEEILNSILPPKTWEEDGQLWTQNVSTVPATRQDVVNLQELLDTALQQTQARETGICPVRRGLYSQCFDELIRQVTINCTERGLLLLRIRDEINMTLGAYEVLYCSAIAFGLRKALLSEEGKENLQDRVTQLEGENEKMETRIKDLEITAELTERRNAETSETKERKHAEEIAFLKKTNTQLKAQLEGIIAPKK